MFYLIISMIFVVLITTFALVLSACIKIDKIKKEVKDLSENQFDAEQVMRLYQMKYNRPIISQEKMDAIALGCEIVLPYEFIKCVEEGKINEEEAIKKELTRKFSEEITPYIEYIVEDDLTRMQKIVKGRMRVLKGNGFY